MKASKAKPARLQRSVYESALKLAAVRAVVDEGMTYSEVATRFGIASTSTLKKWIMIYRRIGAQAFEGRQRGKASGATFLPAPVFDPLDSEEGYRLRRENTRLVRKLGG